MLDLGFGPHNLLVGYHGEIKVNLFGSIGILWGLYYPKKG